MFLLKEILFCSPLIISVGFRIWKLVPQGFFKILFIIFYVFLALAFPFAETLSYASGMGWANFMMIAGYFSLPVLLYLVLWVILVDLALGVALLTRPLYKETVKRQRYRSKLAPKGSTGISNLWNPMYGHLLVTPFHNYSRCTLCKKI